MKRLIIALIICVFCITIISQTSEATDISDCTTISASGVYTLTTDLTDKGIAKCMNITANDVTLNCSNYLIDGDGASSSDYGIYIGRGAQQTANVTIQNCNITDWDQNGVYINKGNDVELYNVSLFYNNWGVYSWNADSLNITKATIRENSVYGIWTLDSTNVVYNDIDFIDNAQFDLYYTGSDPDCNAAYSDLKTSNNLDIEIHTAVTTVQDKELGELIICNGGTSVDNVTIKGSDTIKNNGILISNTDGSGVTFTDVNSSYNEIGLISSNSDSWTIQNSYFDYNDDIGIQLDSDSCTIDNVTFDENDGNGIELGSSSQTGNTVKNSYFRRNGGSGIRMFSSGTGNIYYNNYFNLSGSNRALNPSGDYDDDYNTSEQAGDRIYGDGNNIGGNYYTNYTGEGLSEYCTDSNTDGFCDQAYDWVNQEWCTPGSCSSAYSVDFLPLSDEFSAPTINSNETVPATPRYDLSAYISSDVSHGSGVASVNYTLIHPNGTSVIDNVNGTQNGDIWNSTAYTIDGYGTWTWWVNATDINGGTSNTLGTFDITLGTLTVESEDADQDWEYTNTKGANETFNLTFSHTGNSNNTVEFDISDDLNTPSNFLVFFDAEPKVVPWGETVNVTVTVQATESVANGNYSGNITVNRTDDSSYTNITINNTIQYAVPDVIETGFTIEVAASGTTTEDFQFNNTGDYNGSNCNLTFSTSLSLGANTWNITSFDLNQSTPVDGKLSLTAGATAGTDSSASVLVNCTSYSDDSYKTDSITGTFTITGGGDDGDGGGGGGGGGTTTIYQIVNLSALNISSSPERVSRYLVPGQRYIDVIELLNPNKNEVSVEVSIKCSTKLNRTDESCEWAFLLDNGTKMETLELVLEPGASSVFPGRTRFQVQVDVPENASYEPYKFFMEIKSGNDAANIPYELLPFVGIWGFMFDIFNDISTFEIINFPNDLPILGSSLNGIHIVIVAIVLLVAALVIRNLRKKR